MTLPERHPAANTLRASARTLEVCAYTENPAATHRQPASADVLYRPNVRQRRFSKPMPRILLEDLANRTPPDRIQLT